MKNEEAEEILNNSDLEGRRYTTNLAVINYQMADAREDIKDIKEMVGEIVVARESIWKAIRDNDTKIARLQERQGILAIIQGGFSVLVAAMAGWFGAQK